MEGDDRGILLLHGFAGTPPEMRPLAEELGRRGFTVYAPLLAGHGTSPEELEKTGHRDWIRSANEALDQLHTRCRLLGVAGQSMVSGGPDGLLGRLHRQRTVRFS